MLLDFVSHKVVAGQLPLYLRCLSLMLVGCILHLFTQFRFFQYLQRTVYLTLDGINQARGFLQFPRPVVHHAQAVLRQTSRQSQFEHLHTRSKFRDELLLLHGILRRGFAVLHDHAFTCQPLLMTGGRHQLTHHFLYIVVVMLKVTLPWQVDNILLCVIMRHTCAVLTDIHEVVLHLLKESVDAPMQLLVLLIAVPSVFHRAVFLQGRSVSSFVSHWQEGLVDIEEHTYLTVLHSLVLLLVLVRQFCVCLLGDDIVGIVAVDVLIPIVIQERHTFLMLPHALTPCLRFGELRKQIALATLGIGVKGKDKGIERTDRKALGIELRIEFAACIQPMSLGIHRTRQCLSEQRHLLLRRPLLKF